MWWWELFRGSAYKALHDLEHNKDAAIGQFGRRQKTVAVENLTILQIPGLRINMQKRNNLLLHGHERKNKLFKRKKMYLTYTVFRFEKVNSLLYVYRYAQYNPMMSYTSSPPSKYTKSIRSKSSIKATASELSVMWRGQCVCVCMCARACTYAPVCKKSVH